MKYIIVPTFGRVEHTRKFLDSVRSRFSDLHVVITDDHPDLPSQAAFADEPDCTVLTSDTPLWWVGSINAGLAHVLKRCDDTDIVIFANNDVQLADGGAYDQIIGSLQTTPDRIFVPVTEDSNGHAISSGCQLKSLFPYYTCHPRNPLQDTEIDFATARFLITSGKVARIVGQINPKLVQYHGDYYFSKKAQDYGVRTYITPRIKCVVDDDETGLKNVNILTFSDFLKSLTSIRSANNIRYRYFLFRSFYSPLVSALVTAQMTVISFARYFINMIRSRVGIR